MLRVEAHSGKVQQYARMLRMQWQASHTAARGIDFDLRKVAAIGDCKRSGTSISGGIV